MRCFVQETGIFPYKLATSSREMKTVADFPSISFFYNELRNKECSTTDCNFNKGVDKLFCAKLLEAKI